MGARTDFRKFQRRAVLRCIFCGAPPPLTGEHLFSDWMHHFIPREYKTWSTSTFKEDPTGRYRSRQNHGGDPRDLKVQCVCGPRCNNGWMSGLEKKVKPILAPMIDGKSTRLNQVDQLTLSTWAVLKSIVLEYSTGAVPVTSWKQRRQFMLRQRPPRGWRVWIGHYTDTGWRPSFTNKSFAVTSNHSVYATRHNTQTLTFLCGQVLIHLVRRPHQFGDDLWNFSPEVEQKLVQIWPVRAGVEWPPPRLTASEALYIDNGFSWLMNEPSVKQTPP